MKNKAKQRFRRVLTVLALLLAVLAFNAWKEKNSLAKHKKLASAEITSASENLIGAVRFVFLFLFSQSEHS